MTSILLQAIQDYLNRRAAGAKSYLFDESKESDEYVFGFNFICRYLGYDPDAMRDRIRLLAIERKRIVSRNLRVVHV